MLTTSLVSNAARDDALGQVPRVVLRRLDTAGLQHYLPTVLPLPIEVALICQQATVLPRRPK
jgi:hypothetical protein